MQTLDASGAVSVAVQAETLAEARAAPDRGDAFAVVGIPPGTERDVLKGNTAHIPIYADATYLFIFRTMASGIAVAVNTLSSELAAGGARARTARLRELHRAGGLRADPAADAADRRLDAHCGRAGAGGAFANVLGRGIARLNDVRGENADKPMTRKKTTPRTAQPATIRILPLIFLLVLCAEVSAEVASLSCSGGSRDPGGHVYAQKAMDILAHNRHRQKDCDR